jgi:hypothetical protein
MPYANGIAVGVVLTIWSRVPLYAEGLAVGVCPLYVEGLAVGVLPSEGSCPAAERMPRATPTSRTRPSA